MANTFAEAYLGVVPDVIRALGVTGDVVLPSPVQAEVDAAVALAGQCNSGAIRLNGTR